MTIRRCWISLSALTLCLMLCLLGPLATALVQAETYKSAISKLPENERAVDRRANARRLLDLFDARHPMTIFQDPVSMPGDTCGYGSDLIADAPKVRLPDGRVRSSAAENGYWYLIEAALARRGRLQQTLRADAVARDLGDFHLSFLAHCINSTVFAPQCEAHLGKVLNRLGVRDVTGAGPDREDASSLAMERQVMCAYLDGIASRRGLPLSKP